MRAEFRRADDESDAVVGTARWNGQRVEIDADDDAVRRAVERIFRPAPVVVDDPSFRSLGARGEAMVQPGNGEWFRAAAYARASEAGLKARLVPEVVGQGGWDPAAAYRTFREDVGRLLERGAHGPDRARQAGERAPRERAETGDQPRASDSPRDVQ